MKGIKRILVNIVAVIMLVATCMSLTACKDVRTMELKLKVYDYANKNFQEITMTVDLYAHLAPKTVDAIEGYVKDGYYNNTIFYELEGFGSQVMLGDLVEKDGAIAQNAIKPELGVGEFAAGGVPGSNLTSSKGSIGLWRNWTAYDNTYKVTNSLGSGRATWYMPTATSEIAAYKDWFCVFAQIDLTNTDNSKAMDLIVKAFDSSDDIKEYEIYYTGEYDAEKVNENYGLKFNYMSEVLFSEDDIEDLFKAEGAQYTAYNHQTIRVPLAPETEEFAVKIVSANMK